MNKQPKRNCRNCPKCKNWWFDRTRYGCKLDDKRVTNTTLQLYSEYAIGPCKDYSPVTK